MRCERGLRTVALLLALALAHCASASSAVNRKVMIGYGWDMLAVSTEDVWRNRSKFADAGFDGIALPLDRKESGGKSVRARDVLASKGWTRDSFDSSVKLAKEIVSSPGLEKSMALTFLIPKKRLAWTDDAAWAAACRNVSEFANAVRASGLKGFVIDNEDYTKEKQFRRIPSDPPLLEAEKLARMRGREFFGALFREYPDAVLLFFWMYTEIRDGVLGSPDALTATRAIGSLWPSFLNGLLDVLPPKAKIVDGNETTGYRTDGGPEHFRAAAYESLREVLPLVAPEHRAMYQNRVSVGFGQYLDMYINKEGAHWFFPPLGTRLGRFNRNLMAAAEIADGYIWLYGEKGTLIDWDVKKDRRLRFPVWERQLPGVSALFRAAAGDHSVFARLEATGKATNLVSNSACVGKPGSLPSGYVTWTSLKNPPPGLFSYDAEDGDSGPGCLKVSGSGSYTATAADLNPGDLVFARVSVKGPGAAMRVGWKKDGKWQWKIGSPVTYTSIESDPASWQTLEMCVVVPEGVNGLGLVLAKIGSSVDPVRFDDVKIMKIVK